MSLGPQCLQCKKRRVKCGSELPSCEKCAKDGYECPGYVKALQWRPFKPKGWKQRQQSKTITTSSPSPPPSSNGPVTSTTSPDSTAVGPVDILNFSLDVTPTPSPFSACQATDIDKRAVKVYDTITFFNSHCLPDMSAVRHKGKGPIDVGFWTAHAPAMMQDQIMIAAFAVKHIRFGCSVEKEIYECRDAMIRRLRKYLGATSGRITKLSFYMLVGMMYQESFISPVRSFRIHLDAVRRLITELGGIKKCLLRWPNSSERLAIFLYTDVFSTTTTGVSDLDPRHIALQFQHLQSFEDYESHLLDSCCPCPVSIFQALIRINELRVSIPQCRDTWTKRVLQILRAIQSFDPLQWAKNMIILRLELEPGHTGGALCEWTTSASCYQAAAALYLIESTQSLMQQEALDTTDLKTTASSMRHTLRSHLRALFATYPIRDTSPETPQLWRFVSWPIIMYTYHTVAAGITDSADMVIMTDSQSLFDELRRIGVSIASYSIIAGADLLEDCQQKNEKLVWDEVFREGYTYYM